MKAWDRPPLRSMDDIRREIQKSGKPAVTPDRALDLGDCGMGMPVLLSSQAISKMEPGQVLLLRSSHPGSFPDIHSWVSRCKTAKLEGAWIEGDAMEFYLRRI